MKERTIKRTIGNILLLLALCLLSSCTVDDDGDVGSIYWDASGVSFKRMSFNGVWDDASSSGANTKTSVVLTPDSISLSAMPCDRLLAMLAADGQADFSAADCEACDASEYSARYVVTGYSQQTTYQPGDSPKLGTLNVYVYGIDADDYTFRVFAAGHWHNVTVRFAFDSGASLNCYTGTLSLWLSVRSISVDGRMAVSYDGKRPVLSLVSFI